MSSYKNKIIIGTWSLSGDFGKVSKKKVIETLESCINNGFKEFDTAPTYGSGKMHTILSKITRGIKDIKINTKCGYNTKKEKTFSIKDITNSINKSLEEFSNINTLYLHNPRNEINNWDKIIDLLKNYKKSGLIKYIGISFARDFYFPKKIVNEFDYVQDEINLLHSNHINILKKYKTKIIARSPLASGCLSGKLNIESSFSKLDYRYNWLSNKQRLKSILHQINQINRISKFEIKNLAKFFLLQNKDVYKIIFGVKSKEHVDDLCSNLNRPHILEKSFFKKLKNLEKSNFNLPYGLQGY